MHLVKGLDKYSCMSWCRDLPILCIEDMEERFKPMLIQSLCDCMWQCISILSDIFCKYLRIFKILLAIVWIKSMGDNLGVGFKYEDVFELCQKAIGSKENPNIPSVCNRKEIKSSFRRRNVYNQKHHVSVKIVGGT